MNFSLLRRLAGSAETSHVWHDRAHAGGQQSANKSLSAFGRRIGKGKCPAEYLAEHPLALFQERKNTVELSELAEPVDKATVQQDDSRSFAFVVVGDLDSVKGRERLQ